MVIPAPRIEQVLPSLLEFCRDSVIVGHNVRFDVGFLNAALTRSRRPTLTNSAIDTLALARRLVRDEVPDCRLSTLSSRWGSVEMEKHSAEIAKSLLEKLQTGKDSDAEEVSLEESRAAARVESARRRSEFGGVPRSGPN